MATPVGLLILVAVATAVFAGTPSSPAPAEPTLEVHSLEGPILFQATVRHVDGRIRDLVLSEGQWAEGCPVRLEDLRVIRAAHWNMEGRTRIGTIIVHHDVADGVAGVLEELYDAGFPIARMDVTTPYDPDATDLADFNNTYGFECRPKVGGSSWSEHSYGQAIDVNPALNPYVSARNGVVPEVGAPYVNRGLGLPGMVQAGDPVVAAFARIGWGWGGNWESPKDYMHFSAGGG